MHHRWPPHDFEAAVVRLRAPATDVQLVICSNVFQAMHPFLIRPVPILVPALRMRARELPRIVNAYARDAIESLGADNAYFTADDRRWVIEHAAGSLTAIETATLRLVALRQAGGVTNQAAARLGMACISLARRLARRPVDHAAGLAERHEAQGGRFDLGQRSGGAIEHPPPIGFSEARIVRAERVERIPRIPVDNPR